MNRWKHVALWSLVTVLPVAVGFGIGFARPVGAERAGAANRLTVHEWGTFTALQNEDGETLGGINVDDEPVPGFVHRINESIVQRLNDVPSIVSFAKSIPQCHPDVYVRLETPVVYLYPPDGFDGPIDVSVGFRGGLLTEYYPDATPDGPGAADGRLGFGPIPPTTEGSLTWKALKVAGTGDGTKTDDPVWLAPRQVPDAASVTTPTGERERYLFYRGVGNLLPPLRVLRTAGADGGAELEIRSQWNGPGGDWMRMEEGFGIGPLWLFDARADGKSAFRAIEHVDLSRGEGVVLATVPAAFAEKDYSADNVGRVRAAMQRALLRDGLFPDEAKAMLETWQVSYFKRPGLRLFFMVPRQWTEHVLPMRVSASADVTRVMVGRIELVTPAQRELLATIAKGPASNAEWARADLQKLSDASRQAPATAERQLELLEGRRSPLEDLDVAVPDDYRAYVGLGRFRNALINDELTRRPTKPLTAFVNNYGLQFHQPNRR